MTYFVKDPDVLREDAKERVRTAQKLLDAAEKVYRKDPSRANLISLKACVRLVKETNAMAQEWET